MEDKEVVSYAVGHVASQDGSQGEFISPIYSDGTIGEPLTPIVKSVSDAGLLRGESKFIVVTEFNNKKAVYTSEGKVLGDLDEVYEVGMIRGESTVGVVKYKGKDLIINSNGERVSKDYNKVHLIGYVRGTSPYVLFENNEAMLVDFENKKLLLKAPKIYPRGLPDGSSEYVLASTDNPKEFVIYDKDIVPVTTEKFKYVLPHGLIEGRSKRFIAKTEEGYALYELGKGRISDYYEKIKVSGAVYGTNNILIVRDNNKEFLIDYTNNKKLSQEFDEILSFGYPMGKSLFFIAKDDNGYAIYHSSGKRVTDTYDRMEPMDTAKHWEEIIKELDKQTSQHVKQLMKQLFNPFGIDENVYIPSHVIAAKNDKVYLMSDSGMILITGDMGKDIDFDLPNLLNVPN